MVILIMVLLIVLGALICVGLILQDDNTDKYNAEPSNSVVTTLALGALQNSEAYLDEDSLNGMFANMINGADNIGAFNGDWKLKAIYIDIKSENPCRIYFQIEYKGFDIGLSSDADVFLSGDKIKFTFYNAYAGKLKIPDMAVAYILGRSNLGNLYGGAVYNDLTFEAPSHYDISIDGVGDVVSIEILELKLSDEYVYVKTNPVIDDTVDNFANIIGEDTFNNFKDRIMDFIGDYIE